MQQSQIEGMATEIQLVPIDDIKPNPKNRNKHTKEQIDRLVEIIKYQGFRNPLIVSNRTGLLVAGHGRLEAAKKLGLKYLPVICQYFESEEQEYAAGISDNSIASWADLDLASINQDIVELGPMDIDLLGIDGFVIDRSEKDQSDDKEKQTKSIKSCPSCGYEIS